MVPIAFHISNRFLLLLYILINARKIAQRYTFFLEWSHVFTKKFSEKEGLFEPNRMTVDGKMKSIILIYIHQLIIHVFKKNFVPNKKFILKNLDN